MKKFEDYTREELWIHKKSLEDDNLRKHLEIESLKAKVVRLSEENELLASHRDKLVDQVSRLISS